ncbi:MAG: MoaD/ThiS family protein [Acidobacteriota bacterium]
MPKVDVAALGAARKLVGFSQRTVDFEGGTVADLLRQLDTADGRSLHDNLVCDGKLRSGFAVVINGLTLGPDGLKTPLKEGDQVVTMAIIRYLAGG